MSTPLKLHYDVNGEDFTSAGNASVQAKKALRQLGYDPEIIRRVAIAMYEGEINMVIHADGGDADIIVYPEYIEIVLADKGPGIPDVEMAMQAGFSTAPDNIRALGFGAGMGLPNMRKHAYDMKIDTVIGEATITMRVNT